MALLREISNRRLEPVIVSYNAGISACEKGSKWEQALEWLHEIYK